MDDHPGCRHISSLTTADESNDSKQAQLTDLSPIIIRVLHTSNEVHGPLPSVCHHTVVLIHHVEVHVALAAFQAAPIMDPVRCSPGVTAEVTPADLTLRPGKVVPAGGDIEGRQ